MIKTSTIIPTFLDFEFEGDIPIISVCQNTSDFPDCFTARLFYLTNATPFVIVKQTLEEIRECIPDRFIRVNRNHDDDPVIVEVWL